SWPRDWSSDVCSSDLDRADVRELRRLRFAGRALHHLVAGGDQTDTESAVVGEACLGHAYVALLEYAERQHATGKEHGVQRKQRRSEERRVGKENTLRL